MFRILIVDDEPSMLKGVKLQLIGNKDYEISTAPNADIAINIIKKNEFDLILSDLMMPGREDGFRVIKEAKKQWYRPYVLIMTAFKETDNIVQTIKAGADDLIIKGFSPDEIRFRIETMLQKKEKIDQLTIQASILQETIDKEFDNYQIIGKSNDIQSLYKQIKQVSSDASSICIISGESGTGKELVARSIHKLSVRKDKPFIPVNCAAIPETLIESELFGYEIGAFTGANTTKVGKFELANKGILFLDEISELPLNIQGRLLRALEEDHITRVGGIKPRNIDIMILAATNKDLFDLVQQGLFREDLYYRLAVVEIKVEPLRKKKDDIPLLAQYFVNRLNKERGKRLHLTKKAIQKLSAYNFPGNVRELRNILEAAFVFADDVLIDADNLIFKKKANNTYDNSMYNELLYEEALQKFEYNYFKNLLKKHNGKITPAVKEAGISRSWMYKKLDVFSLKSR